MTLILPDEYLDLSLRDVVSLEGPRPSREPCPVADIVAGVERFARQIAAGDRRRHADQREWLAAQIEKPDVALPGELAGDNQCSPTTCAGEPSAECAAPPDARPLTDRRP